LSAVETFTGGIVSQKLAATGIPSFVQGTVLPSETSRRSFLDLSQGQLTSLSKDPKRFAELLAEECRNRFSTNLGLATFAKIAELQKKGEYRAETYFSLSTSTGNENQEHSIGGELWMVRERAAILALDFLRKYLLRLAPST
jgi:nicotinamide mononucleotide (NMN) deamidase PncC